MFSRAASLRRLVAPAASSLLRPAPAASVLRSSPFSTTTKRRTKKAAVPAPEAAAATAPQQAARDRPLPSHLDPAKVKRPTEIPFQLQFANTVHLVGTIGVLPVLEEKSEGEYQAVSVIVEKKDSSQWRIPIIFQGDLALIAACHLKENDLVYIVGQLSGDEATTSHSKIQIFARSLSFVESNMRKDDKMVPEQDKKMASRKDEKMVSEQEKKMASRKDEKMVSEPDKKMASDHPAEENPRTRPFWNDLLSNPHNWWDNRATMTNPSAAAFKHKDKGQLLWLNEFTPKDVLSKLDTLAFYNSTPKKNEISGNVNPGNVKNESWWTDVFDNPGDWNDNRINKQNGTVNPRYPDFNHKCSRQALWLNSAPGWVQSKLDGLKLVGSSDLTHGSTSKSIYDVNDGNKTLLPNKQKDGNVKDGNLWTDVFANPGDWKDNRINKQNGTVNPRYPDFTHKSSGQALWLDSSPGWVQSKLDDLKTFGTSDSSPDLPSKSVYDANDGKKTIPLNKKNNEDLWKDVIENPTKWWDNRLNKRNPKAPDFRHSESGVALWLNSSPSWVLEKLPPPESATNFDSWSYATIIS